MGDIKREQIYNDAVAYLAERFRSPEQIERIEYERLRISEKHKQLRAQLSSSLQMQVDNSKQGISLLDENSSSLLDVRQTFVDIDVLCSECINLLPNYPIMKNLAIVRSNLQSTLEHGEQLLKIGEKMKELKELIEDDRNILLSHVTLCELQNLRKLAISQTKDMPNEHIKLKKEFDGLEKLEEKLEKSIFHIVEEMTTMAVRRPATLVKVFQVIEREEKFDRRKKRKLKTADNSSPQIFLAQEDDRIKNYKNRMFEILQTSILKAFDFTFASLEEDLKIEELEEDSKMKGLALDGEMQDSTIRYLKEAENMINDLNIVKLEVSKCSPASYKLFEFFIKEYHKHYHHLIIRFVNQGTILSAKDTLLLVKWVKNKYESFLTSNGYQNIEPSLIEPLEDLMINFRKHVKKLMEEWFPRILTADRAVEPEKIGGMFYTDSPVTLFKILNQNLLIAHDTGYGQFAFEIVQESVGCILLFQSEIQKIFKERWKELEFEYIIALINNSHKSLELLDRYKEKVTDILESKYVIKLDYKQAIFGFLQLAESGTKVLGKAIMRDLEKAMELIGTKQWCETADPLMLAFCDTFKDYFINDTQGFLAFEDFIRLVKELLNLLVQFFILYLFTNASKYPITLQFISRFHEEENILAEFFIDYLQDDDIREYSKAMTKVGELLEEKNVNSICQKSSSLIREYNSITNKNMYAFLQRRKDLDSNALREISKYFDV